MIDKQKLLVWISDKKYVYSPDKETCEEYELGLCAGAKRILRMLNQEIELGEFGVEEVAHERS